MQISKHVNALLLMIALMLASCNQVPHVPEVIKTIKIPLNSDGHGLVAVNAKTGYVYVSAIKRITILKGEEILATLETGGENVRGMAVDEARDLAYAANYYSDSVTVIQGSKVIGVVPTIGHSPESVAVESKSGLAYVVSGYRRAPSNEDPVEGNILILNGTQVVDNIKVNGRVLLKQVVSDPIGGYMYAAGLAKGGDKVIVLKEQQEVARYDLTRAFAAMDVNRRTGDVYVYTDSRLSKFRAGQLLETVEVSERPIHWSQLRVHPVSGDVYITAGGQQEGHVLVLRDMKEIGNVKVGGGAKSIAFDPTTQNVYVTNFAEDTVTVINGTQILATLKVGWYPYGIGVNPTNGWVYVSNINDGTVTILGYPQKNRETKTPSPIPPKTFVPNRPYP